MRRTSARELFSYADGDGERARDGAVLWCEERARDGAVLWCVDRGAPLDGPAPQLEMESSGTTVRSSSNSKVDRVGVTDSARLCLDGAADGARLYLELLEGAADGARLCLELEGASDGARLCLDGAADGAWLYLDEAAYCERESYSCWEADGAWDPAYLEEPRLFS